MGNIYNFYCHQRGKIFTFWEIYSKARYRCNKIRKKPKKYYHDYFRLLGGQWQYFPKEIHTENIWMSVGNFIEIFPLAIISFSLASDNFHQAILNNR